MFDIWGRGTSRNSTVGKWFFPIPDISLSPSAFGAYISNLELFELSEGNRKKGSKFGSIITQINRYVLFWGGGGDCLG